MVSLNHSTGKTALSARREQNPMPGEQITASTTGEESQRPCLCITIKNNINWDASPFPEQPIIRLDKKLAVSKSYKCLN